MIPSGLKKKHIIKALIEIDKEGIPLKRRAKKFSLVFGGKEFPPKYVISIANKYLSGKELPPSEFHARDALNYLEKEEFTVKRKINISNVYIENAKDLRELMVLNLNLIEPNMVLYEDKNWIGFEFSTGRNFIDILVIDKNKNIIVIDINVSRMNAEVIGKLLCDIAWVEINLARSGEQVKGIIVERNISEDLILATSKVRDVTLYEYQLIANIFMGHSLNRIQ